jgi:hypothetical protein
MIKIEFLFIFCIIYKKLKMATNICKISGVVYKLTDTDDGGFELSPIVPSVDEMVQPEVLPNAQHNAQSIPKDLQELFDNMPHSIDTLIIRYKSLTNFEIAALSKILRDTRKSDINWLLKFYVYDIYFSDYHYGIKFALAGLLQHPDGTVILNKIKNNIPLSYSEEDILDFGGHSGCSFGGLIYWLYTIFNKMQGDSFNNYHLVFDNGECQNKHYLFLD